MRPMVLFLLMLCFLVVLTVDGDETLMSTPDDLVNSLDVMTVQKGIALYEEILKKEPENREALWRTCRAFNILIELKTGGFLEEKEEYKPILKELGPQAESYGERAYKIAPKSSDILAAYMKASGYHASSMGIVKAIVKGSAKKFKKLAEELVVLDPKADGAAGHLALGRYYWVAPWPVRNVKKSIAHYRLATKNSPGSLHAYLRLGEISRGRKNMDEAEYYFKRVIDEPGADLPENAHMVRFYKEKAEAHLREMQKKKWGQAHSS